MTTADKTSFELSEVIQLFHMKEDDCKKEDRDAILQRINELTAKYGRDYVIKKIALKAQ